MAFSMPYQKTRTCNYLHGILVWSN